MSKKACFCAHWTVKAVQLEEVSFQDHLRDHGYVILKHQGLEDSLPDVQQ